MTSKQRKLLFGSGMAVFVLLLVTLAGGIYYVYTRNNSTLTQSQKNEIYANILKNNSLALLASNNNPSAKLAATDSRAMAEGTGTAATMLAPNIASPDQQSFKYSYTKSDTAVGPAIGSCKLYSDMSTNAGSNVSYYYSANDGTYHSKNINYYTDGSIQNYYLTNSDGNTSTSYEYRGGSFAIKTINASVVKMDGGALRTNAAGAAEDLAVGTVAEEPVSGPVSEPVPTPAPEPAPSPDPTPTPTPNPEDEILAKIKQYFGEDADISRKVTENGKTYYVITSSYTTNCNQSIYYLMVSRDAVAASNDPANEQKIAIENYVNSETFQVEKTKTYFNSISDANLITTVTTTNEYSNDGFDKFAYNFNFEFNVPAKEIVYDYSKNLEKEKQGIKTYLSSQNLTLLFPEGLQLDSIYSSKAITDDYTAYYRDRGFYPAGAKGDQSYNEMNQAVTSQDDWYDEALVNLSFSKNADSVYKYAGVNIHNKAEDQNNLIKNYIGNGGEGSEITTTNTTFKIDGQNVAATKYSVTYKVGVESVTVPGTSESSGSGSSSSPGVTTDDAKIMPPCSTTDCSYTSSYYYFEFKGFQYVITVNNIAENEVSFASKSTGTDKAYIESLIDTMYQNRSINVIAPVRPL